MGAQSNDGKGHQGHGEGALINDPGNEDPGSIIEGAPVPLKNDPEAKPPMQKQVEPPYDVPKAHIGSKDRNPGG